MHCLPFGCHRLDVSPDSQMDLIFKWISSKLKYTEEEYGSEYLRFFRIILTLVLLNPDIPCFANSVDPDQLASEEAN